MAEEDPDAVLSDVEGDEDPMPIVLPAGRTSPVSSSRDDSALNQRFRDLQSELDRERQARKMAEDAHADLQNRVARFKVLAQDAIRMREEGKRDKEEAARSSERAASELAEAARIKEEFQKQKEEGARQLEEAMRQKDSSRLEIESAAQMLVSGIEKISGKVGRFMNFSGGGLPKSQKFKTGLPSIAYGVIKRSNEIAEELSRQVDSAVKDRNDARAQVEQRNYEIAIEVSQLEATISSLREEAARKSSETESFEKSLRDKDGRIVELEAEVNQLRQSGEEYEAKWKGLQEKMDSQRLLGTDLLKHISRAHEQISEIIENAASNEWKSSDFSESQFIWKEADAEENLRTSLEGTASVSKLAKLAAEKVREILEERRQEVDSLTQKVSQLLAEKNHIGNLLRSALSSKMGEVRKITANRLREDDDHDDHGKEDDVYKLAGVLEESVKSLQLEVIELQHQVEAHRAESSLLKEQLSAHAKEIGIQNRHIKELEEKERLANESVEGLLMDIAAAEEEIGRWKLAAEQEAAAGRAIERDFETQISLIRQELEDAKQAVSELENKLKVKEETSAAAIAARDAAEKSLRLADMRSARLRERLEELTQQLGESQISEEMRNRQQQRYICWPWQWLGLNIVHPPAAAHESSNEMELSEPLV